MSRDEWRAPEHVSTALLAVVVVSFWVALLIFIIHRATS